MDADVAVVGLGSVGSAALWRLAARGVSAVGFERFEPGHPYGAGHGESKIFRTAYPEGAAYVRLLLAALPLWRRLEAETGRPLLAMTGGLLIGRPDGGLVAGGLRSARELGLVHRLLEAREAEARWPGLRVRAGEHVLWEPRAGVLRPELAVVAAVDRARELGARVVAETRVESVADEGGHAEVRAGDRTWRVGRVVVAAGAWIPRILGLAGAPFWVERQVQAWFPVEEPGLYHPERFGVFIRALDERSTWYGFPSLDGRSVKVGFHHMDGAPSDPDTIDREIHPADTELLMEETMANLRGVGTGPLRAQVCMYINTPDDGFVIGPLPGRPRVVLAGPMASHGYKFSSVAGEIAADLATEGTTGHDISLFDPRRLPELAGLAETRS
jgi:sarcosine oxidase